MNTTRPQLLSSLLPSSVVPHLVLPHEHRGLLCQLCLPLHIAAAANTHMHTRTREREGEEGRKRERAGGKEDARRRGLIRTIGRVIAAWECIRMQSDAVQFGLISGC